MYKKLRLAILFSVFIIGYALLLGCKPKPEENEQDISTKSNSNTANSSDTVVNDYTSGYYRPVTRIDEIANPKLIPPGTTRWHLTFFWASWCDECEKMLVDVDRYASDNPEISCELISIDAEEAQQEAVAKLKAAKVKTRNRFDPDLIADLQVGGAPLMFLSERTPNGNYLRLANVPLSEIARLTSAVKTAADQPLVFPFIDLRIKATSQKNLELVLLPQNNDGNPLDYTIEVLSRTRDTEQIKAGERPLLRETSENAGSVFEPKLLNVLEIEHIDRYLSLIIETNTGANCSVKNGIFWIIDLDALRAGKSDITVTARTAATKTK